MQVGADVRGEVDLVDEQEVGTGNARTALARDLVARGDVNDVDGVVGQFRGEGGRQVVAATLDENKLQVAIVIRQAGDGFEVYGSVFANGAVWTAAGFNADDAFDVQGTAAAQKFGIFPGVDVVRHHRQAVTVAESLAEAVDEGGLAGADGSADADRQGLGRSAGPVKQCGVVVGRLSVHVVHPDSLPQVSVAFFGYERHSRE